MAQNQPLARHSIDKAREDAREAMQELRGTISEARLVSNEMRGVLAEMRQERLVWSNFVNEGIQGQIAERIKVEMARLEREVTALIAHTDHQVKKRFAGLERSLLATLMNNPDILAVGQEMAARKMAPLRGPAGKAKIKQRSTEFHLPENE